MKTINNKVLRVVVIVMLIICDILLAFIGWAFLAFLFFVCQAEDIYEAFVSYGGFYVYIVIASVIIIISSYHRIRWYIYANPVKIQCFRCSSLVPLTRYNEERYLQSPISLCVPRAKMAFRFIMYRILFYTITYRPYLQLDCPTCGKKQVVCPYCHEPIPQEDIVTKYNTISKCPHCGRRIYTLLPMRDWDDVIYVGDILD